MQLPTGKEKPILSRRDSRGKRVAKMSNSQPTAGSPFRVLNNPFQSSFYPRHLASMKASFGLLFACVLPALSVPHGHPDHEPVNVTTVLVRKTTTICPEPTPPPPCEENTDSNKGHSSSVSTPEITSTTSSPASSRSDLALKRDWNLDASALSQLDLQKSCRMLYAKEEVPLGSRM